jgi:hypothetical protein
MVQLVKHASSVYETYILLAMKMLVLVFWVVTLCGLVGRHQHWYLPASPHGFTVQNTNIDMLHQLRQFISRERVNKVLIPVPKANN